MKEIKDRLNRVDKAFDALVGSDDYLDKIGLMGYLFGYLQSRVILQDDLKALESLEKGLKLFNGTKNEK